MPVYASRDGKDHILLFLIGHYIFPLLPSDLQRPLHYAFASQTYIACHFFFIKFIIRISLFTVRFTTFLTFYVAAMILEAPESDTLRDSLNALRDHLNVFADIQGYRVVVQQSKKTCANGTVKFEDRHRQSKMIREYTRDKRTTPYGQGNFRLKFYVYRDRRPY